MHQERKCFENTHNYVGIIWSSLQVGSGETIISFTLSYQSKKVTILKEGVDKTISRITEAGDWLNSKNDETASIFFFILTKKHAKRIYIIKLDTYLYNTLKSFNVKNYFPAEMVSTGKTLQENDATLSLFSSKTIFMLRLFFIFYSNNLNNSLHAIVASRKNKRE